MIQAQEYKLTYPQGNVFEKRLIESYISEHGSDPVNGEELSTDDLVELKNARAVRPRPPTLTSIPALLSTFQNEWDALALESYTLKQQLSQTRQELSTALYDFEGALRVIAKLTQERDEARDALSKVTVQGGAADSNGDAMQVDGQEMPENVIARIDATQQEYVLQHSIHFQLLMILLDSKPRAENAQYQPTGRQAKPSPPSKRLN